VDGPAAHRLGADVTAFRAAYWQHRPPTTPISPPRILASLLAASCRAPGALDAADLAWLIENRHRFVERLPRRGLGARRPVPPTGGRAAFLSNSGPR